MLACVVLFAKYTYRDNFLSRQHLVLACTFEVFANMLMLVVFLLCGIFVSGMTFGITINMVVSYLFATLIWFYYRMICNMWMNMGERVGQDMEQRQRAYEEG